MLKFLQVAKYTTLNLYVIYFLHVYTKANKAKWNNERNIFPHPKPAKRTKATRALVDDRSSV